MSLRQGRGQRAEGRREEDFSLLTFVDIPSFICAYLLNNYFDVVPVLLLAAQMSREPAHKERKDKLFKASRIQAFLDSIRVSLVEHGVIRRSQTLLGSTVGAIEHPDKWVAQQAQVYQQLTDTLKNKGETIKKQIKAAAKDNREFLIQQIEQIFQDTLNAIPSFAEDHWNSNEISLKIGWEQKLKAIRFEERLNTAYQETTKKFNKVKRNFGHSMNIQTKSEVKLQKSQEVINRILQELVSIQRLKYTK